MVFLGGAGGVGRFSIKWSDLTEICFRSKKTRSIAATKIMVTFSIVETNNCGTLKRYLVLFCAGTDIFLQSKSSGALLLKGYVMSKEIILMIHPTFGVLAIISSVWVFVEALNVSNNNISRLRNASILTAVLIWLAFIIGGYWYVHYYGGDKAIIKAGPWPFAHSFIMETKEHLFFTVLLLATFLPIAAYGEVVKKKTTRNLVMWTSALVVLLALAMEGAGAFISMGVKIALLPQGA
ncbi:MAG: hypothetical protein L3J32_06455 [Rhizobiaceae bacterium]|nr:hypothetical protein [Rhizobiaceae bacterium]